MYISKRLILVVLCTILITILCAPIYSNHLLIGLYKSRHSNKVARIDIINQGPENNAIKILNIVSPSIYKFKYLVRSEKIGGQCSVINVTTASKWRSYKIKFKVIHDGKITILLRGPDVIKDNVRYPVLVDYRFATIKHEKIIGERKTFYFNNSFSYSFDAKDGEIIELDFEARKHHFRWSDLKYYSINPLLFLSVLILSFLLSYKFIQYISKFKLLEHYSRIDIVFTVVFIVLLFIPMSHISTANKSMQENRMLATYPQMFNTTLNLQFGKQFESWFNDRFLGRFFLIKLYNNAKQYIDPLVGNDKVLVGKDGWLFYKLDNGINNFTNMTTLSDIELAEGLKYLSDIDNWCKKHGKEFYYVITPDKSKIYGEYYPNIRKYAPDTQGIGYQFINYIHKYSDIKAIYLRDEILKHKSKDLLYYKNDTHWNDVGAYYGYKKLMKMMNKPVKSYTFILKEHNGDLENMINSDIKDKTKYKYLNKNGKSFCKKTNKKDDNIVKCHNKDNTGSIYMLRDSFASSLLKYLINNFRDIQTYNYNRHPLTKQDLDFIKENVDIVIIENVERNIPQITKLKFPKFPQLVNLTKD